jgi:hypothetical protein
MFNWKRFWCRREESFSLNDDGYLMDPEGEYTKYSQPHAVPFEKIATHPCLALLGEPGIGKSTSMAECIAKSQSLAPQDLHFYLNLNEFGSEDRLDRTLLQSEQMKEWASNGRSLHLFLDSLDECRTQIPTIAAMFISFLKKYKEQLQKLRLRIACRTAEWPTQLEDGFSELWGKDAYGAYELLPLRRNDVQEAARSFGIQPPEAFLDAVHAADAQPLAIKPLTLKFLLGTYQRKQGLPSTQRELYGDGCHLLASENSPSRQDSRSVGALEPARRTAVAARIAATLILCQKTAVQITRDAAPIPPDVVALGDVAGGREQSGSTSFSVTEEIVRETLGTGLFSSRGYGLMGFAHQTYAEFLAAEYLATHDLSLTQIISVICHQGDPQRRVVPQLAEMVAWLGSIREDVFQQVLRSDPQLLLRSDAATADNSARASLLTELLRKVDAGEAGDDTKLHRRFGRFAYPGLSDRLVTYIQDKQKDFTVRKMAISIAQAVAASDLQDLLVGVALDGSELYYVRYLAARAIAQMGDDDHRRQLLPLLNLGADEDPADNLRGSVLDALWAKNLISIENALHAMTPRKQQNFFGSYAYFLEFEFTEHLQDDDLPAVLDWAHSQVQDDETSTRNKIAQAALLKMVQRLDDSSVLSSVVTYAIDRIEHYRDIFSDSRKNPDILAFLNDVPRRRLLVHAILQTGRLNDISRLTAAPTRLVDNSDFDWLMENAANSNDRQLASSYAELASWILDQSDDTQIDKVFHFAKSVPAIDNAFAWLLTPVDLNSDEATKARKHYERNRETNELDVQPRAVEPSMKSRLLDCLKRFESGDSDAWRQLNRLMLFDETGKTRGHHDFEDDLRGLPGWQITDELTHTRIVRAAKEYIVRGQPDDGVWLGTNVIHRPTYAGYRALVLVANLDRAFLETIKQGDWEKWAAIIVGFPISMGTMDIKDPALELIKLAYANASERVIFALCRTIDSENQATASGDIHIHHKMMICWNGRLGAAIFDKAKDSSLKPKAVASLLEVLQSYYFEPALEYLRALVQLPLPSSGRARELAMLAAELLFWGSDSHGWQAAIAAIKSDTEFGKQVIEAVALRESMSRDPPASVPESLIADLYIWLEGQFPRAKAPDSDDSDMMSGRDRIACYRDKLSRSLEARGTRAAVQEIQRIAAQCPHLKWMQLTVLSAREKMLRQSWAPPAPKDILALCDRRDSRLVRSAAELQDLLADLRARSKITRSIFLAWR